MGQTPDQSGVVDLADRVFVGLVGLLLLFFGHALGGGPGVLLYCKGQGTRDKML